MGDFLLLVSKICVYALKTIMKVKSVIQNSFSELFGGLYSGSLAILTDAAHLLTDMSSFIISLVAQTHDVSVSHGLRPE